MGGTAAIAASVIGAAASAYSATQKPKAPKPAPAAPTMDSSGVDAAAEEERRRRANAGRASTILSGDLGESGAPSARKTLLGA